MIAAYSEQRKNDFIQSLNINKKLFNIHFLFPMIIQNESESQSDSKNNLVLVN